MKTEREDRKQRKYKEDGAQLNDSYWRKEKGFYKILKRQKLT